MKFDPSSARLDVGDAFDPNTAEEEETSLLSWEGVKALGKSIGPAIDQAFLEAKYGAHQEILDAQKADLARLTPGTPEYEAQQKKILEQEQTTHEYAAGLSDTEKRLQEIAPNPTIPMQAAMGVAPSITMMAPTLAAQNPIPLAQQGLEMFRSSGYSQARRQGATPGEAAAFGNIAGPSEAITEWIPLGKFFDEAGKIAAPKAIAKMLGRELTTEEINTVIQKGAEQAIVTPEKPTEQFLSELAHDMQVTGLATGMQVGVTAPFFMAAAKEKPPEVIPDNSRKPTFPEFLPYTLDDLQEINPVALSRVEVNANVFNEETGKFEKQKVPANQALDIANSDVDTYKKLLDCLRS